MGTLKLYAHFIKKNQVSNLNQTEVRGHLVLKVLQVPLRPHSLIEAVEAAQNFTTNYLRCMVRNAHTVFP